jgi:hypothetical protein
MTTEKFGPVPSIPTGQDVATSSNSAVITALLALHTIQEMVPNSNPPLDSPLDATPLTSDIERASPSISLHQDCAEMQPQDGSPSKAIVEVVIPPPSSASPELGRPSPESPSRSKKGKQQASASRVESPAKRAKKMTANIVAIPQSNTGKKPTSATAKGPTSKAATRSNTRLQVKQWVLSRDRPYRKNIHLEALKAAHLFTYNAEFDSFWNQDVTARGPLPEFDPAIHPSPAARPSGA